RLERVGPTACALGEQAWLHGDFATVIAESEPALEMARRGEHAWFVGELAFRLHLAGRPVDASGAAEPWQLLIAGDWRASAAAWERVGCPYERAEALALGNEQAMREALAGFDRLGVWCGRAGC